jgi:O-antigen/teichoic acid export membrane protein
VTSSDNYSAEEIDAFQKLKKKSLSGMGALFVRQILVKVIFFIGNIVLARLLAPQVFGLYAIASFVVQFFSTFGDVGIGAALIQKRGELSREELSTTFWLQQILVWLVVVVIFAVAPLALKVYATLPLVGVWLIRAMAVSFLFSSLKTIPAILMERNIDFKRIAWVDITENLAFQVVAISGALMGLEAWSFILAAITRALLGALMIFAVSPWRPAFIFRFSSVKGLVQFGLPYQGNQILSFIKDAVTPLFVGVYAGAAAVGYVNWARNFAFAPLLISESFGRVAFPAFSRLQGDRELLARTVERSIRMMTLVLFPITAIMFALGPELTHVVFTDKWMPGIHVFYLYCMSPGGIGIFLPLYSAILSLGNTRILLFISLWLIAMEWGMGVYFVIHYGFTGVAFTQLILVPLCTCVYVLVLRRNKIHVTILSNIGWQLAAAVLIIAVISLIKTHFNPDVIGIGILASLAGLIYLTFIRLSKRTLLDEFREYLSKMVVMKRFYRHDNFTGC